MQENKIIKVFYRVVFVLWIITLIALVVSIASFFVTFIGEPASGLENQLIRLQAYNIEIFNIKLGQSPKLYLLLFGGSNIILGLIWVYIYYLLKEILRKVLDQKPFFEKSFGLLRKIGVGMLVWAIAVFIRDWVITKYLISKVDVSAVSVREIPLWSSVLKRGDTILWVLGIFVLAEIFKYGIMMQREQNLTI